MNSFVGLMADRPGYAASEAQMPHSKSAIYVHLVWATWQREPMITDDWENRIYACMRKLIHDSDCEAVAIGGVADHVHVLVRLRPKVAVSSLVKKLKGVTSRMVNQHLTGASGFKWQPGYGAFSLSYVHLEQAEYYVRNQKRHHSRGDIWPMWEETSEPDD